MFVALWAVIALTLATVLGCSGVAKLRSPRSVDLAFRDLAVPARLSRPWMRRVFPWAELALAAALLVTASWLAVATAAAALALFGTYLALVARALARGDAAACACFGEGSGRPVGVATLVRNIVLVVVAALGLVALLASPDARSAAAALLAIEQAPAVLAAAVAAIVVFALARNGDLGGPARDAARASATAPRRGPARGEQVAQPGRRPGGD